MEFHKDKDIFWAYLPLYFKYFNTGLHTDSTTLYAILNSVEDIENNLQIALDKVNIMYLVQM